MRYWGLAAALVALIVATTVKTAPQDVAQPEVWAPQIPAPLVGPYIVDPDTLAELDATAPGCADAGPLNFQCLVYQDDRTKMQAEDLRGNPFMIRVFDVVREAVRRDLEGIRSRAEYGGVDAQGLKLGFLKFAGAKIELVGVINRMDRQFNKDDVPGHGEPLACGEISAVYRFGYEGDLPADVTGDRHYRSRLPVTMNVVFPAIPWSKKLSCAQVATRWVEYAEMIQKGASVDKLRAQARLLASSLRPEDIDRIELNMQGSRVSASDDNTDFGTLATYIIRVFRYLPGKEGMRWRPSYLTNQIDRARLLGKAGDDNTCEENVGKKITRAALADYLFSMNPPRQGDNAIGDVDYGLVNIPQPFLACRAISVSPGGAARSGNQPFWNSADPNEAILDDKDIEDALARYRSRYGKILNFVGNAEEFRTRLNEASCSGCHQTRAIAGFHFPGADRANTAFVNAVFLPGSPHFFGDQLRRMEILRALKTTKPDKVDRRLLAASYASRPQKSYSDLAPKSSAISPGNMQLLGGWGGSCLIKPDATGVRQWGCAEHLECRAVFASANQPNIGMCVNPKPQVGEAMQFGTVATDRRLDPNGKTAFGFDRYRRQTPALLSGSPRNTTIATDALGTLTDNSWFAAHQEYYEGIGGNAREPDDKTDEAYARRVRDHGTGGFPGGSLRLSECNGLSDEATCGLLASSGFNDCLGEVAAHLRTPESCFKIYTSYAAVRACDPANPCRDDYICLRPMGMTQGNASALVKARSDARDAARRSQSETEANRAKLAITYFGEKPPHVDWLQRNAGRGDRRGLCIPPYFVFQFKADGHAVPAN